MRARFALVTLTIMLIIAACSGEKQPPQSLVSAAGVAPYYTSLNDALQMAGDDQYVVVEFYTDW